jgi:hypothetical protein
LCLIFTPFRTARLIPTEEMVLVVALLVVGSCLSYEPRHQVLALEVPSSGITPAALYASNLATDTGSIDGVEAKLPDGEAERHEFTFALA